MREPDERRFAELMLYVSEKSARDPKFGATKLNKILFYSDFLAFAQLGDSITGFEYQKLEHGPAPRRIVSMRKTLEKDGALTVEKVPLREGREQVRLVPKRKPRMSVFGKGEIAVVDEVIKQLWGHDAESVSALSHIEIGWQVAQLNETIPYGTIFLSDKALNDEDVRRIQHFAEEHGYTARR
ncbi:MAG TPA: Panacea domain-containing protein [Bryobacteraceae bacterium]|nr:Panacea domain-containing protein [Bryobacteraceae bacterium]